MISHLKTKPVFLSSPLYSYHFYTYFKKSKRKTCKTIQEIIASFFLHFFYLMRRVKQEPLKKKDKTKSKHYVQTKLSFLGEQ